MAKDGVYVLLILLAAAALVGLGIGVWRLLRYGLRRAAARRVADQDREDRLLGLQARWQHYVRVTQDNELVIGVYRGAIDHDGRPVIFDQPKPLFRLPAEHDTVEVQTKIAEARDRAAAYNLVTE